MKNLASAIVLIAMTLPAIADGAPSSVRERTAERREARVWEVLQELNGRDHAWRSNASDVRRLLHEPGFLGEYMARRDSNGLSTSRRLAGHCVGLMTNHAPPPYDLVIRPCNSRGAWDIRKGGTPVMSSSDLFATEHEARTEGLQ